ncbi:branched-chain amino acid transaminase [Umezawaea endophytica]|uniref:Branched-chain-amino-acid aminotransferase n=1 Tax=Umezawaea endophytica TaxID=1654476 RepID=A0A9X2VHY0_9PSEU|nr:branched-chain amino acid transaminase [Umezawaea endophytica]MCS7476817.1 branched-chain amino acid transaminase [Umezawaea endophytica]
MNATSFPVWIDGAVVPADRATVHVMTPTLHYGWGVYEGVRFYETARGPSAFRLTAHLRRLRTSARALSMEIPYTDDELARACRDVVAVSGLSSGYLRPLVFLAEGAMSVAAQLDHVRVAIGCWSWPSYLGDQEAGIRVRTSGWVRSAPNAVPPSVKSTGGYVNASLARLDAVRSGAQEAIMLNAAGRVAEASAANVFIVVGGELATPPLSEGILPGITRDAVLAMADDLGVSVVERPIAPAELRVASEVMLAGTAVELTAVAVLDDVPLSADRPVFDELRARFDLAVQGGLPGREDWAEALTPDA